MPTYKFGWPWLPLPRLDLEPDNPFDVFTDPRPVKETVELGEAGQGGGGRDGDEVADD